LFIPTFFESSGQQLLNLLKETIADGLEPLRISKDPDARMGHQRVDPPFLGYKTPIAMTKERIITAAVIRTGKK